MRRHGFGVASVVLASVLAVSGVSAATASAATNVLKVTPKSVNFGTQPVGSFTLKGARITNTSSTSVLLLVTPHVSPDDFSFGLLPGSTCPALAADVLLPGESCQAVMGFRPSEFFAGQEQTAALLATATDPVTGAVLEAQIIEFTGKGRLSP